MLDVALQFLVDELNSYLFARTNSNSVVVKLGKVVDETGKYAFAEETLCASIINIEEERTFRTQLPQYTYVNGQHLVSEPELKCNLSVLIAANFKLYDQALKFVSYVLTFFQSHPSFTSEESPALDPRVGKLTVELQSPSYEQLNQIWAFIGGKQLPSVLYKVRMVVLQDEVPSSIQPPLTVISTEFHNQ